MKSKYLLRNYIQALDKFRDSPDRQSKDLLYEAECDIRVKLEMPTEHLKDLYRAAR
jgi:hypothetical protein